MFAVCWPEHQGSTLRGTPENFGPKWPTPVDLSVGDIRSQIAADWLHIAQRSQWRAYRKPSSLFRMVPSLTPYDPLTPKWGFHVFPRYANGHISATRDPIHFMFGSRVGFSGAADRMALFPVTSIPAGRHLGYFRIAISPKRLIRSTYVAARSSLR